MHRTIEKVVGVSIIALSVAFMVREQRRINQFNKEANEICQNWNYLNHIGGIR